MNRLALYFGVAAGAELPALPRAGVAAREARETMLGVRTRPGRQWLAPVVTGACLLAAWTVPLWSDPPASTGVTVTAEPQVRQPGTAPAAAVTAGFGVDVQVDGAGAGQPVSLEMWSGDGWAPTDRGLTDGRGQVHLVAPAGTYGRILTDVDGSRTVTGFDAITSGPPLAWSDEFGSEVLAPEWLAIPQPDDGSTCTMTGDQGVEVSEGRLVLRVVEDATRTCDEGRSPMLVNGHLVLRSGVAYGTTAARIKLPVGRSVSGQFWLQPGDPVQRWVMDDEHEGVVIAETRGTGREPRLGTSLNRTTGGKVVASDELVPPELAATDGRYHVYSVVWTPTGFEFSIDGEVVRTVESATPTPLLTIGLGVLPQHELLPADEEERAMYVDWLRVWGPRDPRPSA